MCVCVCVCVCVFVPDIDEDDEQNLETRTMQSWIRVCSNPLPRFSLPLIRGHF